MKELKKLSSTLIGEEIILRHINLDDAPAMFEYTSNPENIFWITIIPQTKVNETETGIENYFLKNPEGKYGIILKSENKLIGTIDIRPFRKKLYDIGYVLNKKYQGQGYGFAALNLLIKEVFLKTEISEVYAYIDSKNDKSNSLIRKCGFKMKEEFDQFNAKLNTNRHYFLWVLEKPK